MLNIAPSENFSMQMKCVSINENIVAGTGKNETHNKESGAKTIQENMRSIVRPGEKNTLTEQRKTHRTPPNVCGNYGSVILIRRDCIRGNGSMTILIMTEEPGFLMLRAVSPLKNGQLSVRVMVIDAPPVENQ
jgi:hypothetical protein